jgi:hypothetical protein
LNVLKDNNKCLSSLQGTLVRERNSQILRRPQDDKEGVVHKAKAFVAAWHNSHLLLPWNDSPSFLLSS